MPPRHALQAEDPGDAEKEPVEQPVQAALDKEPVSGLYSPAAHPEQLVDFKDDSNVPAGQLSQGLCPDNEKLPGSHGEVVGR